MTLFDPTPASVTIYGGRVEPVILHFGRDHKYVKVTGAKRCGQCGYAKSNIVHTGTPPSLNVLGSGANRFVYQGMKKAWQQRIMDALHGAALPAHAEGMLVEGRVCFGDRIRRDQGNHRFILEKACGDALTATGILADDDWSRYEFGGLELVYRHGESWTELVLFPR